MNKDKAIQLLERLQDPEPYEPMLTKDAYDAIQMAIDALSANGDTISRKAAIEVIDSFNVFESRCDQIKLEQMIGELPPANCSEFPNSSDTISRAKAIEALDKRFDSIPMEQTSEILMLRKDLRELPPAQPEPYTDVLKAEIKRMKRSFTICINSDYYTGYMSALSAVEGYIAHMEVTT